MSNWDEKNNKITRTFLFKDFVLAMEFVNKVATLAEAKQHHPDIFVSYSKVTLMLCTHDAGYKITAKDREMADEIDKMYSN